MSGGQILEQVEIDLRDQRTQDIRTVYIDVFDNSLSRKWLAALNSLLDRQLHLEKNYCFFGFVDHGRNGPYILTQINASITAINAANIGYHIDNYFDMSNTISDDPGLDNREYAVERFGARMGRNINHEKFNWLHRYFEDLQGVSGAISPFYHKADPVTRWHIRQLNLLCHEFESWAMSYRKQLEAPDWQRPSQLMCWLNAPRFVLDDADYELFGVETINRPLGGVFVGVNKAVGKHHWEVFNDEGRDSRVGELISTTLKSQTEAAGDFDIEWGQNPAPHDWQKRTLQDFREWLLVNGFDPEDKSLTIGHPQIGQVNLEKSFAASDYQSIWKILNNYLDVYSVRTSTSSAVYDYCWSDADYIQQQVSIIAQGEYK
jgi:hypothetical protein